MYCPRCGMQNPDGSTFCQSCGAPIAVPTPATVSSAATRHTSGLAVASLVLGIIGFFTGITSILALVFGAIAMGQTKRDLNLGGRGMAIAGFVMGIVVLSFGILFVMAAFLGALAVSGA